jgi:hypothetical protein
VITVLYLFATQGLIGAFDTLYYHEYRARLAGGGLVTREELTLHGVRDLVYALLFGSLPFLRYEGGLAWLLAALVAFEIVITMRDFVVEDRTRKPLGGVYPGERITHAIMGIIYGGALAHLLPEIWAASSRPTAFVRWDAPPLLALALSAMSLGVFLSGIRDLAAAWGPAWCRFPWGESGRAPSAE